jgi:uncharacterized protein YegP (UPF0339 family)
MTQPVNQWKFYQDRNGQWQWRKFVANKVVAVSLDGFSSRRDCIWNAVERGYLAPHKKYRYSKVPLSSGLGN